MAMSNNQMVMVTNGILLVISWILLVISGDYLYCLGDVAPPAEVATAAEKGQQWDMALDTMRWHGVSPGAKYFTVSRSRKKTCYSCWFFSHLFFRLLLLLYFYIIYIYISNYIYIIIYILMCIYIYTCI